MNRAKIKLRCCTDQSIAYRSGWLPQAIYPSGNVFDGCFFKLLYVSTSDKVRYRKKFLKNEFACAIILTHLMIEGKFPIEIFS